MTEKHNNAGKETGSTQQQDDETSETDRASFDNVWTSLHFHKHQEKWSRGIAAGSLGVSIASLIALTTKAELGASGYFAALCFTISVPLLSGSTLYGYIADLRLIQITKGSATSRVITAAEILTAAGIGLMACSMSLLLGIAFLVSSLIGLVKIFLPARQEIERSMRTLMPWGETIVALGRLFESGEEDGMESSGKVPFQRIKRMAMFRQLMPDAYIREQLDWAMFSMLQEVLDQRREKKNPVKT